MTHRKIKDGDGKAWDVWEVYPSAVEQRMSGEHPAVPTHDGKKSERRGLRVVVPEALQQGWLAFQCDGDRRRVVPIPANWIALDDAALIAFLDSADRQGDGQKK
jgi:hypothetical protein